MKEEIGKDHKSNLRKTTRLGSDYCATIRIEIKLSNSFVQMYSRLKETSFGNCCSSRRSSQVEDISGATFQTKWKSIWISTVVAFIGSVQASSLTPSVWPYMQQASNSIAFYTDLLAR